MNIVLTTRCNKNCSFCFARQYRQDNLLEDMTILDFQRLLNLVTTDNRPSSIKLLGGEPTLHPEFPEVLDILKQRHLSVTLISNLLYTDPEIRESIVKSIKSKTITGCLANAAELDNLEKLNTFKTNYAVLAENLPQEATPGITLSRDKTLAEETAYLDFLAQNLPEIPRLRLSLDFLDGNQKDYFFINNKEYGKKIVAIIQKCLDLRIPISWDCKIYPCLFESKDFDKYLVGFVKDMRTECNFNNAPFDVFPDMSYIHCYPAQVLSGQNILKFSRLSEALGEIAFLKRTLQSQWELDLPADCQECSYHKNHQCDSLCIGCQELTGSFLNA